MPTIPPATGKPKRTPPKRAPQNVRAEKPVDTPSPPISPLIDDTPKIETPVTPKSAPKPRAGTLEARLSQALASMAMLPALTGDQYSSFILASRSEKFAHDLAELAKVNKRVKTILENFLDGGAYGGVMFSGAAMLLPILWAYGVIPAPPVDIFAPFYPQVPPTVVPRSARTASRAPGSRAAAPGPVSVPDREGAPSVESPIGVVTVKPNMVPPMNPAAL